jgi:hypothetical protein
MSKSALKELGGGIRLPLTGAVERLNEKVDAGEPVAMPMPSSGEGTARG